MFSGIVEEPATVVAVDHQDGNVILTIKSSFACELKVDQSVAHNGVCLTVTSVNPNESTYTVTAVEETLRRSNLGLLRPGSHVNLERSMIMNGRLDGHIVQGHVDCTAKCTALKQLDGSVELQFEYTPDPAMEPQGYFTVEKGSVTVNGVSLTVCNSRPGGFGVAIIPYTLDHTNLGEVKKGTVVNLEFDIIGKYVARLATL
ncbi:MAG: riboflavin synthase [Bacteroides sp.]|nr:riboflavin synthase [Bacteroides sp.]MCM1379230.1 riboflavin synthase [Bacteroides sp.]MCM1445112.1 riboflavin synthase [Prevotella sp.]